MEEAEEQSAKVQPWQEWRVRLKAEMANGEALERVAADIHERSGVALSVYPSRTGGRLGVFEMFETLEWFSRTVRTVSEHLGTPRSVGPDAISYGAVDRAPDLRAEWTIRHKGWPHGELLVAVSCSYPRGCKVDPRIQTVEPKFAKLHPECAAVLRELEDIGDEPGELGY